MGDISRDPQIEFNWEAATGAGLAVSTPEHLPEDERTRIPLATDVAAATYIDSTADNETKCDYWMTSVNPDEEESDAPNQSGRCLSPIR